MDAPLLAIENLRTYFYSRAKRAFIRSVDGALGAREIGRAHV